MSNFNFGDDHPRYDFRSMLEEFTAMPPQPRITRNEHPKNIRKLKKRTYRTQLAREKQPSPLFEGALRQHSPFCGSGFDQLFDPPHDFFMSHNTFNNRKREDSQSSMLGSDSSGILTPPRNSLSLGRGGKRRKTINSSGLRNENEDGRYQLVLQMQLLRTTLEDEEALVWSSSEDESEDDDNNDEYTDLVI